MAAAIPTLDQAIDAVLAQMSAMSPLPGVIVHHENHKDDEIEFIKGYKIAGQDLHLWLVDCASPDEIEGGAAGENYTVYNIRIRYLSVMVNNPNWSRDALKRAELVRDTLNQNAAVFAIGGKRQLQTPETCNYTVPKDFKTIGDQRMYEIVLGLNVEGRRFA